MICDDVITLISEDPQAHGVFDQPVEVGILCYCRVSSVKREEFYRARSNGIEPVFTVTLSEYADYHGEKIVEYRGKRYRVIRSYVGANYDRKNDTDIGQHSVELTIGEVTTDA